ncbi:uncharacterized protein LOC129957482 [Argiope bruennichi]|uniref:Uncharacterized protein n=1 Tax=Argiope bruennichi TaxID=94029 RepID=A0A8T0FD73_ARGBR|nr:uncharacterized protein LOC129957482 [Argiope bruennichi]KAF8789076.1 hypothetical protein HNY73_007050 [Argiope bruennichi]
MRRHCGADAERSPDVEEDEARLAQALAILGEEIPLQEMPLPAEDAPQEAAADEQPVVEDAPIAVAQPGERPPIFNPAGQHANVAPDEIQIPNGIPYMFEDEDEHNRGNARWRRSRRNAFILGVGTGMVLTVVIFWLRLFRMRPRRRH